jgi:hypothetical protein
VARPGVAVVLAVCMAFLGASCGGGSERASGGTTTQAAPAETGGTLESLWRAPGEDVAVVAGTSDHQVGRNRVSFLVVDKQSRLVERPTAKIWVSHGLKQRPFATGVARLEPIGVPGGSTAGDVGSIYVTTMDTPTPGTYWFLAEPVGGRKIQALGNVVVKRRTAAPTVGDRALPTKTPTLASTNGDLDALTTSRRPDRALYERSIAQALGANEPFVVTFATPQFCQTRTCGPGVEVVSAVRKEPAPEGVRFIHVEIYKDNDPAKGVNRWVKEWRLPTEPFTYVVDRTGVIRTKFEGAFSARELERAVKAVKS